MNIINMNRLRQHQLLEAGQMLTDSLPLGWATLDDAMQEINDCLSPGNTMLAALENGQVIGWGGILAPIYNGHVFELHPLVVRTDQRHRGIGRAIVQALEEAARSQGGLTLYLGSDDERDPGETSFADTDLYDHLADKLRDFQPGTHPAAFYQRLGFQIVGVMPDANGIGKPDIIMAKRL